MRKFNSSNAIFWSCFLFVWMIVGLGWMQGDHWTAGVVAALNLIALLAHGEERKWHLKLVLWVRQYELAMIERELDDLDNDLLALCAIMPGSIEVAYVQHAINGWIMRRRAVCGQIQQLRHDLYGEPMTGALRRVV